MLRYHKLFDFFAIAAPSLCYTSPESTLSSLTVLKKVGIFFFISCVFTFHTPALSFTLPTNFLSAEIELNTKCVVDMEDNQTVLHPPPSNGKGESR